MSLASRRRVSMADMLRNELEVETADSIPLSHIFSEEPPTLSTFVTDAKYLDQGSSMLGPKQYDFVRHFEQILDIPTYILMVEEFGEYWNPVRFCNEFAIEWGKGSGKDHCCQICFARVANILLCLNSPQDYYGMPHQTIIHMLNVAASAPQAHGVFFKPLRTLITRSPWFADKFEGGMPGPQAQEIRFRNQIELISGHSQAETLEGKNLLAAIADEISAFPTNEEVQQSRTGRTVSKTSDAILEMLRTSATTRFPKNFKLAQISFPRYKGDAIEQAVLMGKQDIEEHGEASQMYVSGPHCTWDVNPRYDQFERVEVEGATSGPVPDLPSIIKDYRTNPSMSRAKYECKPELAENRFFWNDTLIFQSFEEKIPEPIEFIYYWGYDESGIPSEVSGVPEGSGVPGWQVKFVFNENFRPMAGCLYAIHGDLAIKGDRAGVAMSHVKTWEKRDWAVPGGAFLEQRPVVKVDFAHAFEADAAGKPAPREVQIRWYRKLIWSLRARGFQIEYVSFDNFQSTDMLQILESWGITAVKASTDRTNELYNTLRDVMYDGRLQGYHHPLLIEEIRRLSLLKNGKIDHPPAGSKDIADALAGSVAGAVFLGGDEGETPLYADQLEADIFIDSGHFHNEMMPDDAASFGSFGLSQSDYGF